jgi:D-amino peptidase
MSRFRSLLAASASVLLVIPHANVGAQRPFKVFVSADMEGVAGIVAMDQLGPPGIDYEWARHLMTAEVNTAIAAAFDAGATEVLVNDGHGSHTNLKADEMDQRASLVTGTPAPLGMAEGMDSTFGAVICVGFHARASTEGAVIDHTYTLGITDMTLNGVPVGEYGMSAAVAGYYGVPVVFISGDSAVAEQARSYVPGIETVITKEAITRFAARTISPQASRAAIAAGVRKALARRNEIRPVHVTTPITLGVELTNTGFADNIAMIPGTRRTGARTLTYVARDMLEAYRVSRLMMMLAH